MKNKIDIIVEARFKSSRLPGKVLLEVVGKPLLELMIERLKRIKIVNDIIVATTVNKEDDEIVSLCKKLKIPFFRGSENDVLDRVVKAAQQYHTDIIVEITGDNPLVDPDLCQNIIKVFLDKGDEIDFVSNDIGCYRDDFLVTYPLGLCNTKVFKRCILEKAEKLAHNSTDREHVVNYIINNSDEFKIYNVETSGKYFRSDIRLTLDYLEDYKVIKAIFEALYVTNSNFTASEIIDYLDANPDIKMLNTNCIQERYQ